MLDHPETEAKDLQDLLPVELFNHPDCFGRKYWSWESEVAAPALQALGYKVGAWYSTDSDSFGPLVREVKLTKDGTTEAYFYG